MGETERSYDVIVIGGGPGGYVAAARAAQRGLRTALIEAGMLGGVCLNWGCIPTKALLRSAHFVQQARGARRLGLRLGALEWDYAAVQRRSRQAVDRLVKAVQMLLDRAGVEVWLAQGRLDGRQGEELRVRLSPLPARETGRGQSAARPDVVRAPHVVLASGGRPRALPGLAFDGRRIVSSRDVLAWTELPRRLLIAGGGAIGLEFADVFSTLGVEVRLVEMMPQLLPGMEPELAESLRKALIKRRVKIETGAVLTDVVATEEGVRATIAAREALGGDVAARAGQAPASPAANATVAAEALLVAIGVSGNTEELGLESVGLAAERGYLSVDRHQRTGVPGLYAIGDVTGPPMLAHAAAAAGVHVVEHLTGTDPAPIERNWIPGVVYTDPEVAAVGETEAAARQRHGAVRIGRFPFVANGRAVVEGETSGFVKLILAAEEERLLGAHIVGPGAGELIAEPTLLGAAGIGGERFATVIHAHPTLSEAIPEAWAGALGEGLHG